MCEAFVSVISTIGGSILKCSKLIEISRLCVPGLPEELLDVHSAFLFG